MKKEKKPEEIETILGDGEVVTPKPKKPRKPRTKKSILSPTEISVGLIQPKGASHYEDPGVTVAAFMLNDENASTAREFGSGGANNEDVRKQILKAIREEGDNF